ncbi:hypothetical protein KOR34_21790 [Posidoniimonas corsicana]|uniref:DUF1559 domain-containing protein n=1 Tax=Posidoniimonas corsicana TaxID=1938618 RepID=A0A5C5VHS7_9BACT|nr:DUF1559 domain-containing protein [Posidoniimonas corsicana]TWT37232.1 hypothetical protein KOR34_21790 [Posidoniimonas corsicana]
MTDENPYESAKSAPPEAASGRAMAFVGKVALAIVALLLLAALLLPATRSATGAAHRNHCLSQLKQLTLAMANYEAVHGTLPPAYTVDAEGNKLHSWRTLLLPYLEMQPLYESIDLTKPWDDPANQHAREASIDVYNCPSAVHDEGMTTYVVVTGKGMAFDGPTPTKLSDVKDLESETLAIVDVNGKRAVHWMSPDDITLEQLEVFWTEEHGHHPGVVQAAFIDGRARALSQQMPLLQLRAMLTIAGGETIGEE